MHSVAKRSNPADLQKLPSLRVVLAVSLALITPAGTSSGEVLLRSVHSDRVRSHEISASSLLLPHVRLVRKAARKHKVARAACFRLITVHISIALEGDN